MEVNLSPSLATDAPLDALIKSHLIVDTLNLVGIKKPSGGGSSIDGSRRNGPETLRGAYVAKAFRQQKVSVPAAAPTSGYTTPTNNKRAQGADG